MAKTVAAIATPLGSAGLGVVRLSGDDAAQIADRVFRPVTAGKTLTDARGYTALYGHVYDGEGDIDECVALVFRAPHSYTGEPVVEFSCHGGGYLLRRTLRAVLAAGARSAEPGEFTRRAFLNGKMDLTQAEAVGALIGAQGQLAAQTALAAREGRLYRAVEEYRQTLLDISAQLAAFVDYPEDETLYLERPQIEQQCVELTAGLTRLLETYDAGRILREGVDTVIVGRPNVGKSSLMNRLSGYERSIVTDIPGTTRDVVEDTVRVGNVVLNIADTAGLRDADDPVERLGVDRTRQRLSRALLVLAVFDGTHLPDDEDRRLAEALDADRTIAILNKQDRASVCWNDCKKYFESKFIRFVEISAHTGEGIAALTEMIEEVSGVRGLDHAQPILATERQRDCVMRCREALERALAALREGWTWDAVEVELDEAIGALLELTGERATEAVVDRVFEKFCVGK